MTNLKQTRLIEPLYPVFKHPVEHETITTVDGFLSLMGEIKRRGFVALDTETTGLDPRTARFVGFSAAIDPDKGYYIPINHVAVDTYDRDPRQLDEEIVLKGIRKLAEWDTKIIWHNGKFDYQVFEYAGIRLPTPYWDTLIGAWILAKGNRRIRAGLKWQAENILDQKMVEITDLIGGGLTFAEVPVDVAAGYAAADSALTIQLYQYQLPLIEGFNLAPGVWENEMKLVVETARMEMAGVEVEPEFLKRYGRALEEWLIEIESYVRRHYGDVLLTSTHQLKTFLPQFGFDLSICQTTPTGAPSLNDESLTALLDHHQGMDPKNLNLLRIILEHRAVGKLNSTYVRGILERLGPGETRLYANFNQAGTVTARFSSSNPNLQNIPSGGWPIEVRHGIRARIGFVLVGVDLSQAELRTLAHVSGDQNLIAVFDRGEDPHKTTASNLFNLPEDVDWGDPNIKLLRRIAKTINFGTVYGISAYGLAGNLNADVDLVAEFGRFSVDQAQEFLDNFFRVYPGIKAYNNFVVKKLYRTGEIRNLFGFVREFPVMTEPTRQGDKRQARQRSAAIREAGNHPIQGSVAGLIRLAMVETREAADHYGARQVAQIHDEIIFEVPEENAEALGQEVADIMAGLVNWRVPMAAEADIGLDWFELKLGTKFRGKAEDQYFTEHRDKFRQDILIEWEEVHEL